MFETIGALALLYLFTCIKVMYYKTVIVFWIMLKIKTCNLVISIFIYNHLIFLKNCLLTVSGSDVLMVTLIFGGSQVNPEPKNVLF